MQAKQKIKMRHALFLILFSILPLFVYTQRLINCHDTTFYVRAKGQTITLGNELDAQVLAKANNTWTLVNDWNKKSSLKNEVLAEGTKVINWYLKDSKGNYVDRCKQTIKVKVNPYLLNINTFGFKLYPNPAHEYVVIESNKYLPKLEVLIFDYTGKLVYKQRLVERKNVINVSLLPVGIYSVQLYSGSKICQWNLLKR